MDNKSMTEPDDKYNYYQKSVAETGLKWLWNLIIACLWLGAIISIIIGSSALQILGNFVIAAGITGAFYFVHYREHGHF